MTAIARAPSKVSMAEFDEIFESVKNWGRWGPDDQLGTLNYITPEKVREAAGLVRSGRRVSMEIPLNKVAGPDNPNPAIHFVSQAHDIDIGSSGLRFGLDFLGMACHGDCHSHVDALCHVSYKGQVYNGKPAQEVLTSQGATTLDIANYGQGLVGRGVLLDLPRFRGVKWLEPGEAVTRAELEACEAAQSVSIGEGDIFVYRTGHHRRRLELGAVGQRPPAGGRGQGRSARRHRPLDARATDRRVPAGRRRRGGPKHGRGDALSDPSAADRGHGDARRGQPAIRGSGHGLRGGGPLGIHGRRPAAPPARRDRLAVEPDRDLLREGAIRKTDHERGGGRPTTRTFIEQWGRREAEPNDQRPIAFPNDLPIPKVRSDT